MDAANFSAADADELRRAMGAKRSGRKMEILRERFYAGLSTNDITGKLADHIFLQVKAFSGYGFPLISPNRHPSDLESAGPYSILRSLDIVG